MPKYCITHDGKLGDWEEPGEDCMIVYSPIPDLDMSDEWVDSLVPPSEDEMILMDMAAEVLEADLGHALFD